MLACGLRFDKPECSWRDIHAMFTAAPPGSSIHYELHEKWPLEAQLLAANVDAMNTLLWTKTKDAQRKPPRNRPEPIKRPGVTGRAKKVAPGGKQAVVMSLAEFVRRTRGGADG